jgi:hypothetical protein
MKRLILALLLSAAGVAQAAEPAADDGIFVEGTRYSAVLHRQQGAWRLLAGDERRLRVSDDCRGGTPPPRGLWLLTRDGQGHPQLVAPSSTVLPPGHPGRIRLLDCRQPAVGDEPSLALPDQLLNWLDQNSGSIYVAN